jgi:hypothetical protein
MPYTRSDPPDWDFSLVAGWAAPGIMVLIVMSETRIGPFARLATFVLGLPAVKPVPLPRRDRR